jgi:hypothetical protein
MISALALHFWYYGPAGPSASPLSLLQIPCESSFDIRAHWTAAPQPIAHSFSDSRVHLPRLWRREPSRAVVSLCLDWSFLCMHASPRKGGEHSFGFQKRALPELRVIRRLGSSPSVRPETLARLYIVLDVIYAGSTHGSQFGNPNRQCLSGSLISFLFCLSIYDSPVATNPLPTGVLFRLSLFPSSGGFLVARAGAEEPLPSSPPARESCQSAPTSWRCFVAPIAYVTVDFSPRLVPHNRDGGYHSSVAHFLADGRELGR